jgi:hypothetical protein
MQRRTLAKLKDCLLEDLPIRYNYNFLKIKDVKKIKCLLAVLSFMSAGKTFAQTPIDYETSYLYFLRITNSSLESIPRYFINTDFNCAWFYSSAFDHKNYEIVKDDEFKRNSYYRQLCNSLRTKISGLNFKNEYYFWSKSSLGEYDFSTNSFPIVNLFKDCYFLDDRSHLDNECLSRRLPLRVSWVLNREYLNYSIKIPPAKAESIIDSRKKTNGSVDRSLQTKIIFSFVNEPYDPKIDPDIFDREGFIIYVSRVEFYDNNQLIGSVKPTINFQDPALGFRVKNGEDSYFNRKIIINRINGIPNGPVKFYKGDGALSRIVNCSYYFPTHIYFSGDDVRFFEQNNKTVPYSIQQYKDNQKVGYWIQFYQDNTHVYLQYVTRINSDGSKDYIDDPMGANGHTHLAVKQLPADAQELIKKYDYGNYFQYSIGGAAPQASAKDAVVQNVNAEKVQSNTVNKESSTPANENDNILSSSNKGGIVNNYIAGTTQIYTNKKSGNTVGANVLFMFINKEDEIPYQKELITEVSRWIKENVPLSPADIGNIKIDSLVKVGLNFSEKFRSYATNKGTVWYADLKTSITLTKDGKLLYDKSFLNSTTMLAGKTDKWIALEDAISKSEKKIGKILEDYMPVK